MDPEPRMAQQVDRNMSGPDLERAVLAARMMIESLAASRVDAPVRRRLRRRPNLLLLEASRKSVVAGAEQAGVAERTRERFVASQESQAVMTNGGSPSTSRTALNRPEA